MGVKGSNPHSPGCVLTRKGGKPLPHLLRGPLGKGCDKDTFGRDPIGKQASNAAQ